jgi:hypothetical protein
MPHDHGCVQEEKVFSGTARIPRELLELFTYLFGPRHVVEPDGP